MACLRTCSLCRSAGRVGSQAGCCCCCCGWWRRARGPGQQGWARVLRVYRVREEPPRSRTAAAADRRRRETRPRQSACTQPPVLHAGGVAGLQYVCTDSKRTPQGRLNQWAHWARAHGPRFFSSFRGPPTGCGEINFSKLIFLLFMLLHDRTNTSSAYLVNLHTWLQYWECLT